MNTKPTVIEGWAISQYPGGRFLFEDHKPSKMYKRASLVIGDKAVPLSVVVEMLPYMRHGSTCQYKTQVAGCGHPCVCGLAALKATLAKDFNITL